MTKTINTLAGVLVVLAMFVPVGRAQEPLPGSSDAVNKAINEAVTLAVDEMLSTLSLEIDSVAVFPLDGDGSDGRVTARTEYAVVNWKQGLFTKVVTRDSDVFQKALSEFEFTEKRFDIMPAEERTRFGRFLGVDAIVYGSVRQVGIDDTKLRGRAEVSLSLLVVETGQVIGSGWQMAVVPIDVRTPALAILSQPWFWLVVIGAVIVGFVVIIIGFPLRRRMALAAKPRDISR